MNRTQIGVKVTTSIVTTRSGFIDQLYHLQFLIKNRNADRVYQFGSFRPLPFSPKSFRGMIAASLPDQMVFNGLVFSFTRAIILFFSLPDDVFTSKQNVQKISSEYPPSEVLVGNREFTQSTRLSSDCGSFQLHPQTILNSV